MNAFAAHTPTHIVQAISTPGSGPSARAQIASVPVASGMAREAGDHPGDHHRPGDRRDPCRHAGEAIGSELRGQGEETRADHVADHQRSRSPEAEWPFRFRHARPRNVRSRLRPAPAPLGQPLDQRVAARVEQRLLGRPHDEVGAGPAIAEKGIAADRHP